MAEVIKIKVSSLPEAVSLDNLVVLGVDGTNSSVKVPILLLKGNKGDNGTEIELQKTSTHLQWRYVGGTWANLVALEDLKGNKGDTGANIELQKGTTHLQWRVSGTTTWNNLVSLTDLKGAKGETGEGFIIKGYYNTLSALQLAVPTPNAGDAYGVGNSAPFDIYVYNAVSSAWVNNGALQGPAGASSYTYIAYASNSGGANFSLTDGAYIAIKTTTTPIANPVAGDFAGLWKHYKVTAAEVIAGVQVGGRNLLPNANNFDELWSKDKIVINNKTEANPFGANNATMVTLQAAAYDSYRPFSNLVANIPYTISLWVKLGTATNFVITPGNGQSWNSWGAQKQITGSGWQRISTTIIPNSSGILYIHIGGNGGALKQSGGTVTLYGLKLEYGNISSDWTPAPEDFASASHTHSGLYEPAFSKNTAFNKNFGNTAGTVAEGDHTHALLTFLTSQSTVTTLASLPVTKRVIVASVTAATTLSLAAALEVGRELHIKVYNTSASAITQPLPTSAPFESKKTDGTNISSISIPAGGSVEISILSVTDKYIIKTDA